MNAIADDFDFDHKTKNITYKGPIGYTYRDLWDYLNVSFGNVLVWMLADSNYEAHEEYGTDKPKVSWLRKLWWRVRRRRLAQYWVSVGRFFKVDGKDIRIQKDALSGPVPIKNFANWLRSNELNVDYVDDGPLYLMDGLNIDDKVAIQLCRGTIIQNDGDQIFQSCVSLGKMR